MKTVKFETFNTLTGEKEFERTTTLTQHELDLYLSKCGYAPYGDTVEVFHANDKQIKKVVTVLK